MNFNINVSQLIQGVITAVINSVSGINRRPLCGPGGERIEKKAINGKPKE